MNNRELKRMRIVFLAPSLVLFTGLVALPSIRALIYSVQHWDGLTVPEWVGFENFRTLFSDDLFVSALTNNLILMFGAGSLTLVLALIFATLIHRGVLGAGLFRVAFFFPNIIAAVAVAILWQLAYSTTEFGIINGILGWLEDGFIIAVTWSADVSMKAFIYVQPDSSFLSTFRAFAMTVAKADGTNLQESFFPFAFTDSKILIYSLIPMLTWISVGFYMVLFLAAMQSIPEEFYEAASLEGANTPQQFWHVTLPLIREVFVVGVVFFIISSAKFFDAVWVIESEFPNKDSHTMATVLYQKVFTEYNVGYAASVAVVLFLLVFLATLFTLKFSRRDSIEY